VKVANLSIMSFKKFITSRVFFLNIILVVIATVIFVWLSLYFISRYTNHGESFPAPNFYGLEGNNIELLADEVGVRYVINDSLYNISYEPGTIIEQSPQSGHYIKKGRKIYLVIAARNPEYIALPKLTDVSLRQACIQIEAGGLVVGNVEYRPSEFNNLVLGQSIGGDKVDVGEMVPKGTVIDLVVGKISGDKKIIIPDFAGMNMENATNEILKNSLSVGAVIYDESVQNKKDSLNARIWKQSPAFGKNGGVELGTSVDLWLSLKVDQ
jgi:beta-lactam-binding protein with PASTA domain